MSTPLCERARYLCTRRNTHWRYPGLAGDRRRAFSIVLVGNQIADYERLTALMMARQTGRLSSIMAPGLIRVIGRL